MKKSLKIDVYSDIACPWCFIGTRRLHQAVEELGGEVEVSLHHHPYLLHPGAPAEGVDIARMLAERYGADPRQLFARVEAAARDAGIELDLSRQQRAYDTTAAHTLLRHAESRGTQWPLLDALFSAYFVEAQNVADASVLAEVAAPHGFEPAEVEWIVTDGAELAITRLEAADATRRGVRGVPFFVVADRITLSGAQPLHVLREAFARAIDGESAESAA